METEMQKNKTALEGVETVVIKLPRIRGAENPVFVRVNEYTCEIVRGASVEVPAFVAEVLEHSEQMEERIAKTEETFAYEG